MIDKYSRVAMPKTKSLRVEATGCVIYVDHRADGIMVEVVPDGSRFAGTCYMGRTSVLSGGKRVDGEPTAHGLRIIIENDKEKACPGQGQRDLQRWDAEKGEFYSEHELSPPGA